MLSSYLKIALRNLFRNGIYSIVSILGLAIGLTASIFIYQYSAYEMSYERFYRDYDRIYRISYQKFLDNEQTENLAKSPAALASALVAKVPEVEYATKFYPLNNVTLSSENSLKFNEDKVYIIDSSFLKVFSPVISKGTITGEGILISESIAEKYFKNVDLLNSVVSVYEKEKFDSKIIGVFKDLPTNTHFDYQILIIKNEEESESWQYTGYYTYLKLKPDVSLSQFSQKINALAQENVKKEFNIDVILTPQPLKDIRLHSDLQEELSPNGNYNSLVFLILAGFFILIIAWINHVNLSIAKSAERLKEIGIRKVIGSQKLDLIKQFLLESSLYSISSVILAFFLILPLSPYFNDFSGKPLLLIDLLTDLNFWIGLLIIVSIGIITTGFYPALIYSKFKTINALKGAFNTHVNSGFSFKKLLMVFQFSITTFLIIGTLVIFKQMDFMRNSNLGIDINNTIVVKSPNVEKETWSNELSTYVIDSAYFNKVKTLRNLLSSYNSFKVASISHIPGKELIWGTEGFRREGSEPNTVHALYMAGIDYEFFPTFKIELMAGRNFSEKNHRTDQLNAVIINEEASKILGFENPESAIGKNLIFYDNSKKEIIGVVKNYHQESLKRSIKPTFYQLLPRALDYFAVSIPSGELSQSVSLIKENWAKVFSDQPLEYFFLDDFFNAQYQEDQKFGEVFTVFTILSIFIACIGLFGLSSYLIMKRTKEIGIRKILGASLINILGLLSVYYIRIVLFSFIVAAPICYMVMSNWLNNFYFRIDLEWWIFIVPLIATLLITLITIGFQSIRTSLRNPVNSLRTE